MPLKLSTRAEKTFILSKSDPAAQTTVTLRQASQKAIEALGDLLAETTRTRGSDQYITRFNWAEAQAIQAYHTMSACDILDENDQPLFPSKETNGQRSLVFRSLEEFRRAWSKLPPDWAAEIYECILEMNPVWNPQDDSKNSSAEN